MPYHLIQMSEPRNIIEVIDFLRTLHKPSEFDFSRANLKPNKEKRFMAFIHSLHMSPSEAIRIITHLTKEELVKGPSPSEDDRTHTIRLGDDQRPLDIQTQPHL